MYQIIDANGEVFGRVDGYKSHSSAAGACTRMKDKLWNIFHNRIDTKSCRVYTISEIKN